MKRIEDYIEKVYRNFDEKDEETKILKEETKAHLLEEVEELKKQGLTEEESINRALSNFGSENVVIGEMNFILKRQHKYLNVIAKLALCVLVVAVLLRFIGLGYNIIHRNDAPFVIDYDKVFKNTSDYLLLASVVLLGVYMGNKLHLKNSLAAI